MSKGTFDETRKCRKYEVQIGRVLSVEIQKREYEVK